MNACSRLIAVGVPYRSNPPLAIVSGADFLTKCLMTLCRMNDMGTKDWPLIGRLLIYFILTAKDSVIMRLIIIMKSHKNGKVLIERSIN
jgi:hypothetical protein